MVNTIHTMQYFAALREGQKRVANARDYLNAISNGNAMPALALRETKTTSWEPVGEEMYYAFISNAPGFVLTDKSGYILVIVDDLGHSKAIIQNITAKQKETITHTLDIDGVREFKGDVILPI